MSKTELIILGSGTAVPTAERGAASYLLSIDQELILMDCGPGATRRLAQAGFSLNSLSRVLISHFHPDHICDLTAIIFGSSIKGYQRTEPLEILGPVGLKAHYNKLTDLWGRWIVPNDFELIFREFETISDDEAIIDLSNYRILTRVMAHSYPAIGFRIETTSGTIVYSGDTDYCNNIVALCQDADLAVLECSTPNNEKIKGHLTPELAAKISSEAQVKHLILSHFYPSCEGIDLIGQCRIYFAGQITLAKDFLRFTLE